MKALYSVCSISIASFATALVLSIEPFTMLNNAIRQDSEHGGAVALMLLMQTTFPLAIVSWLFAVVAIPLFRSADIEGAGDYRLVNNVLRYSCRLIAFSPVLLVVIYILCAVGNA
ncbi:hypothetical protein [Microbulbifer agarilyticus]